MPKRTHSRHLFAKQLRGAIAAESVWAIHPPKLAELHSLAELAHLPGQQATEIQAAFGVQADDPSRLQRVGNVAVLPITGMIQPTSNFITRYFGGTSLELLEKDFRAALADSQVKSIVLFVDSYGGNASQNDEVSKVIFNARGKKPIVAFVRGGCCSAAYYLASAADSIVASSSSMIGSVGTIAVHQEYADYLAEMGVKATVITHGKNKGHGNAYEKLSPEARATLQKTVDDFGNQFESAVARNRGVAVDEVRSKFGQGQAFLAAEAKTRGLVDRVGTWEQVLSQLNAGPAPLPTVERENAAQQNESESSTAAAASAATTVSPPVTPAGQEVSSVDPRIKAMLFARGLITSIDASDEVCKAALNGYFGARNETVPATPEATVAALMAPAATPAQAAAPVAAAATPAQAAAPVAPAAPAAPTAAQAAAAEQQRILDLQAGGAALGVAAEQIQAAITAGTSYEAAAAGWVKGRIQTHAPVNDQVRVGQDGSERWAVDASNAIALRLGCASVSAQERNPHVERLQHAPLLHFAQESLRMSGTRVPDFCPPEQIAEMALMQAGNGGEHYNIGVFATGPINRPGDFPNLLSGLANKIFEDSLLRSEATWDQWCGRVAGDLPDFKPVPMIGKGQTNQLDEVLDADEFTELAVSEELLSYMQLSRYGNQVSLTPVMVANDDLGAFTEDMFNLQGAHDMTLNRLALNLITGNVTLLDGIALYESGGTHKNIASVAAAPTATAWEAAELLYYAQTSIGSTGYLGGTLKVCLVPPKFKVTAQQTFMSLGAIGESKQAATDATLNVYRNGDVRVVVEPELQRSSAQIWYAFADPVRRPTVKVAFFRGWGRKGRRERWYDPKTKCQVFSLEGRFGAAVSQYRTTVRNPGT